MQSVLENVYAYARSAGVWPTVTALVTCLALTAFQLVRFQQQWKSRRYYGEADHQLPFSVISAFGLIVGPGIEYHWYERFRLYKNTDKELFVFRPRIFGQSHFYTRAPEVLRQMNGPGWDKPDWGVEAMRFWGENLVSAKAEPWKRHRRILQPAFNSKTYEMVWNESTRFYHEMVAAEKWPLQSGSTVRLSDCQKWTSRFTLCVILSCGFGIKLGWDEKVQVNKDDPLTLDEGINLQGSNILLVTYAPRWVLYLPFQKFKFIRVATDMMRSWFKNSLAEKRALTEREGALLAHQPLGGKDIFTRLVQASDGSEKMSISESEIIGNTWVFFFAGHETAATVLAACFCFLALHKAEQDILHQEVVDVLKQSSEEELQFEHYESLVKTRAAFVEALRMVPPGNILVREAVEDTVLQVPVFEGGVQIEKKSVPVKKGSILVGDMIGIQYNPRLYPEPEKFQPSRWYGTTGDEAYSAFSLGNRVCIGKKFALMEGVCFLANVMRDYEVEPWLQHGETLEMWKERVLNEVKCELTMTLVSSPVTFRRR